MKRIFITLILSIGASCAMMAQTMFDGLAFTENNYVGSARTLAMGNAFTALGGDTGSIGLNPAGSAVASHFVITLSPGLNTSLSITRNPSYASQATSWDRVMGRKTGFCVPNVGAILAFNTRHDHGVKRVTLGFASNTSNTFLDNTYARGDHYGTSFAGWLASRTDAPYADLVDDNAYNSGLSWDAVMGAKSGMISTASGHDGVYIGATEKYAGDDSEITDIYAAGTLEQKYGRLTEGFKNDIVLNVGIDIGDCVYIGANVGIEQLAYTYKWYIRESAADPGDFEIRFDGRDGPVTTAFTSLKYSYSYSMKGTGLYGKLGIIATPGKCFRIGAALQTPSSQLINEGWGVSGETSFTDSRFNSSSASPDGRQSFRIHGPWRASLGLACTIGRCATVSADYESAFFSGMRLRDSGNSVEDVFWGQNQDIATCMGVQHSLRTGAEYKVVDFLAIRVGYSLLSSPVRRTYNLFDELCKASEPLRHSASIGIGFSSRGSFFCDIAMRSLFYGYETVKPYDDYICDWDAHKVNVASPEILSWRMLLTGVATFGFRF